MADAIGNLVVERPKGFWRDRIRKYKIVVDGVVVGSVGNGQKLTLSIAPGPHRLQATIDWSGSQEVEVEANGTTRCLVEPNGGPLSALTVALTTTGYLRVSLVADE